MNIEGLDLRAGWRPKVAVRPDRDAEIRQRQLEGAKVDLTSVDFMVRLLIAPQKPGGGAPRTRGTYSELKPNRVGFRFRRQPPGAASSGRKGPGWGWNELVVFLAVAVLRFVATPDPTRPGCSTLRCGSFVPDIPGSARCFTYAAAGLPGQTEKEQRSGRLGDRVVFGPGWPALFCARTLRFPQRLRDRRAPSGSGPAFRYHPPHGPAECTLEWRRLPDARSGCASSSPDRPRAPWHR